MPRDRIGDLGVEKHRRTESTQHQQEARDSTGRLQGREESKAVVMGERQMISTNKKFQV